MGGAIGAGAVVVANVLVPLRTDTSYDPVGDVMRRDKLIEERKEEIRQAAEQALRDADRDHIKVDPNHPDGRAMALAQALSDRDREINRLDVHSNHPGGRAMALAEAITRARARDKYK